MPLSHRLITAALLALIFSTQAAAQVQARRPVPLQITLGFNVTPSWSIKPHNGIDYVSPLGNPILSVGPGGIITPVGYTKPNAHRFGSINPDGTGPAIWAKYTLASGEPIYVLVGHTADSWTDNST